MHPLVQNSSQRFQEKPKMKTAAVGMSERTNIVRDDGMMEKKDR